MRALNIGSQLYQMDVVMRMCAELQRKGEGGGVTEEAQEELSGRSAARRRKKGKASRDRGEDVTKEARMAWTSKKEEFMQRKVERVEFRRGELMKDFRERQARACLPDEKYWKHICCACMWRGHS